MTTAMAFSGPPGDAGLGMVRELAEQANRLLEAYTAAPAARKRAVLERLPRPLRAVRKLADGFGHPSDAQPEARTAGAAVSPIGAAVSELQSLLDAVSQLDPAVRRQCLRTVVSCTNKLRFRLDRL